MGILRGQNQQVATHMNNRVVFRLKVAGRNGDIAAVGIGNCAVIGDGGISEWLENKSVPFLVPFFCVFAFLVRPFDYHPISITFFAASKSFVR